MEIEFVDVEKFCRLCLKPNPPYLSMFENRATEMLESLTSIRVSDDDPGSNVTCFTCFVELRSAYETQQKLIETEILVQDKILGNIKVKNQVEKSISKLDTSQSANDSKYENIESSCSIDPQQEIQPLDETDNLDEPNEMVFNCPLCPMKYKASRDYADHMTIHQQKKCLLCPNLIPWDKLKEHRQTHESGYCEYCGKQLKNSGSLRHHVNLCHREPKITCEQCGVILDSKKEFDLHMRRIHTNNPGFVCDYCGLKFFGISQLNRHIKEKHSDQRPFKCCVCNESFAVKWRLKMHERSKHSNVMAFTCDLCGRGFKFKSSLNVHKKSVHGWKPEEKFQCLSCSSWFPSSLSLSQHMAKLHNK